MGDVADYRTWNVFRRRHAHGLCCAVPSDAPVPTFLLTGDWTFAFQYARGDPYVAGFSPNSAEVGARYNGFYLFLGFGHQTRTGPSSSQPEAPSVDDKTNDCLTH